MAKQYGVFPIAGAVAAGSTATLARLRVPLVGGGDITRASVSSESANGAGAAVFDVRLDGVSVFAEPADRLTLDAGDVEGFTEETGDTFADFGALVEIIAVSIPAGGFPAGALTLSVEFDDGIATGLAGDVAGPFGANIVTKIRENPVAAGALASRQVYKFDPVAAALLPSDSILTIDDVIRDLYFGAYGRAPSSPEISSARDALREGFYTGAAAFVEAIRALGLSLFVSAEYTARARSDEQFINDLYLAFIGRDAEPGGLSDWLDVLAIPTARPALVEMFSHAQEFVDLRVPRIYGATSPGVASRASVELITASAGDGGETTGTVALGRSFVLLAVTVSHPCRVRLYRTAAQRGADASREPGTDPAGGTSHGVILDLRLDAETGLAWQLSPAAIGANGDEPSSSAVYYAVTNESGAMRSITLQFSRLLLES